MDTMMVNRFSKNKVKLYADDLPVSAQQDYRHKLELDANKSIHVLTWHLWYSAIQIILRFDILSSTFETYLAASMQ